MKRTGFLTAAFACLIASVALIVGAGLPLRAEFSGRVLPGERPIAPEIDAVAPPFTGSTPEGEAVDLLALRGSPVLINFWATWCGPCKTEMPAIQAVYEAHQANGLHVLAVNLSESAEAATAWSRELGLTFDVVLDSSGQIASLYRLRGQPSTYVVAPTGVITQIFYGPTTRDALESAIKPFLSGA